MANKSASSWHPAMMPNSAADLVAQESKAKSEPVDPRPHINSVADLTAEKQLRTAPLLDPNDEDEADAWLVPEDTVVEEPVEISHPTESSQDSGSTMSIVPMEPTSTPYPAPSLQPFESTESHTLPHKIENNILTDHDDAADAWLTNGDDGESGGAWLLQDEGVHRVETHDSDTVETEFPPLPEAGSTAVEGRASDELPETKPEVPSVTAVKPIKSAPSAAQHSSSMSFARTVSHEVSFGDDDDGEWNLGRSEADFNNVMPRLHQTRSVPDVPPMAPETPTGVENPLKSNEALEVMDGDEKVAEAEKEEYLMRSPEGDSSASWNRHDKTGSQISTHRSIGGELEEVATVEEEERLEEILPLIPRTEAVVDNGTQQSSTKRSSDLFGGGLEDNDDEFFGQFKDNEETRNDDDEDVRLLERKSTIQVMDATDDGGPLTRQSTLNDTLKENVDSVAEGVALEVSDQVDGAPATEDLASKWEQAFGDDDDDEFLLDDSIAETKDVDATAFLGSDDEGLLDDDGDDDGDVPAPIGATSQRRQPETNPYAPASVTAQSTKLYTPATSHGTISSPTYGYGQQQQAPFSPYGSAQFGLAPQPLRPEPVKTESFADKSKVGYSSPYDLPTDLIKAVKPGKRSSPQQLPTETGPSSPRSVSMYSPEQPPHPPPASATTSVPPMPPTMARPPLAQNASAPALHSRGSFFEELPMTSKPRPASRQSQRVPSPSQYSPIAPPQPQQAPQAPPPPPPMSRIVPPPTASRAVPPPVPVAAAPPPAQYTNDEVQATTPGIANLMSPPKANPYANLQSKPSSVTPPSNSASRYSPAPPGPQGGSVSITSRYSPAPSTGSRPNSSYGTASAHAALPHLPRTSSPLAHYETSGAVDGHAYDRRASSSFEPRLNRVSSLPPTREVDEEEDEEGLSSGNRLFSASHAVTSPTAKAAETRYGAASPGKAVYDATPPLSPGGNAPVGAGAVVSPPKRPNSNYAPQPAAASAPAQSSFAPPPRAGTQSPNALHTDARRGGKPTDYTPQPLHAHVPSAAPNMPAQPAQPSSYAPTSRSRGQSITKMVTPTDGRERDPLERWRGAPLMAWGVGGTFVTSFPKSIPRYAMGQTVPVTIRTVGEVKVQNIKDLDPLQDGLAKFPGPLKGKSKKKEALAWLTAGIDIQEGQMPDASFHSQLSLEAKRSIERLLLWKLLRVFIEHDGVLEGSPAVDKAVRQVLAPETAEFLSEGAPLFSGAEVGSGATSMQADGVDIGAVEKIRLDLLKGDRKKAAWAAVDKRLWGHAMLISQTVSADLYKQVAQEFVRKEVNYPGHNNESLAALFKVLSGNYDDCVDELVPSHARAGLQLVSTEASSGPAKDAMAGLDKWRETLTLVLSNRSGEDIRGLHALGKLLSSYGRPEAAHICFMFSRSLTVFGGLDDVHSDFVLVGSDHKQQSDQFAKDMEALQLSEVYEYGLTLGNGVAASAGAPHLAAYKLQHAATFAEYGFRDKAIQYCDAIASAIIAQTRRSPYHHPILEASVEDFLARLKSSPKDASSSWMSKPTMGKVSDSMWNRFNKFVSGDEDGNGHAGSDGDNGPFARIAHSPNMSRSPSTSNFDVHGSSPGYQSAGGAPLAVATGTCRYAPAPHAPYAGASANPYAPASQLDHAPAPASTRSSQEYVPNPYEPAYPGAAPAYGQPVGGNQSVAYPASAPSGHQTMQTAAPGYAEPLPASQSAPSGGYQPYGLQELPAIHPRPAVNDNASQGYEPQSYGYEAPSTVAGSADYNDQQGAGSGGYEPPSLQPYGYEPSPYSPDNNDDEEPKPKKSNFMYDDEDDIPALRKSQEQTKSEKDRENEEMFRKVAEEDAKRAAAAASSKKAWGFGAWFGGGKKGDGAIGESSAGKPIKAKLGEQSSFVYDPDLGRWVNKKPGAENVEAKKATPPPPRAGPGSMTSTPQPPSGNAPPSGRMSVPPMGQPPQSAAGTLATAQSMDNLYGRAASSTGVARAASSGTAAPRPPSTGPPSRPPTSMSNACSIDDLLGAPAPRKAGPKKAKKGGRYVDVMAK